MFQQAGSIEIVVPRTIGDLPANGRARKWPIVCVLPTHLERREVPVVTAGRTCAVGVRLLMTAGTIQTGNAFTLRLSPTGAAIESALDESGEVVEIPLRDLRRALRAWVDFLAKER